MTKYIIYQTTNILNGKIYIGKHACNCKRCYYFGSGKALLNSIKLYGKKNFKKEILFEFDNEADMNNKEVEIVNSNFVTRSDTYNLGLGGEGGSHFKERIHSKETKMKISLSLLGHKQNKETRNMLSEMQIGIPKPYISDALRGKKKSEEHKRKISESLKGRKYKKRAISYVVKETVS